MNNQHYRKTLCPYLATKTEGRRFESAIAHKTIITLIISYIDRESDVLFNELRRKGVNCIIFLGLFKIDYNFKVKLSSC